MNRFYKKCGLALLTCLPLVLFAQLSDSFYNALPDTLKPKNKAVITLQDQQRILKASPDIYSSTSAPGLQVLANRLAAEMAHNSDLKTLATSFHALGKYYSAAGSPDKAITWYNKAIAIIGNSKSHGNTLAWSYSDMAVSYFYKGQKDSLVNCLHSSSLLAETGKDSALLLQNYNIYSVLYSDLFLYEKAAYYADLAIKICPASSRWGKTFTDAVMQAGIIYGAYYAGTKKTQYADSAISFFNQILAAKKQEAATMYMPCYVNMANIYFYMGDYKQCIIISDSAALPKYNSASQVYSYPNNYYSIPFYKALSLMRLGYYKQGKQILDTLKITEPSFMYVMYSELYNHADKAGDWENAYNYYKKYMTYWRQRDVEGQKGKIFEAEQKYSVSQKEAAIAKLETSALLKEKEKRNIITSGVAAILLLLVFLYFFSRQQKNKRQKERDILTTNLHKLEDEMNLERAQTLAEQAMAMANQRKNISQNLHDEVSSSLATLQYYVADLKQQATYDETKNMLTDIEQETHQVYLQARSFMHGLYNTGASAQYDVVDFLNNLALRFGEGSSLQIHTIADADMVTRYFTPLHHNELYRIIKEAVVNSMKHSGANRLDIQLQFKDGVFNFSLSDNGGGISANGENGIGLVNLKERMAMLKGSLKIKSSNKGTVVSGSFPAVLN